MVGACSACRTCLCKRWRAILVTTTGHAQVGQGVRDGVREQAELCMHIFFASFEVTSGLTDRGHGGECCESLEGLL